MWSTPAALALLKAKDADAWQTIRRLQALPMMPEEDLVEAVKIIRAKAPLAFRPVIDDFEEYYIRGPKTGKVVNGQEKRRPAT